MKPNGPRRPATIFGLPVAVFVSLLIVIVGLTAPRYGIERIAADGLLGFVLLVLTGFIVIWGGYDSGMEKTSKSRAYHFGRWLARTFTPRP